MREHLNCLMQKINFDDQAKKCFLDLFDAIKKEDLDEFSKWGQMLIDSPDELQQENQAIQTVQQFIKNWAEEKQINDKTADMFFLLLLSKGLKERYLQKGLNMQMYYDLMADLTCKLNECKQMFGVWGTSAFKWLIWHFKMRRFALGRFQYEEVPFRNFRGDLVGGKSEYIVAGVKIKTDDTVYRFHIPSSGAMPKDARQDSYKKAYDFFKVQGNMVLVCESWLLDPNNQYIYPENSNLLDFFNEFEVITHYPASVENPFSEAWRVFGKNFTGDITLLPQQTTLQKNFAAWLKRGNSVGAGFGVIIFDGENILTKK